MAWGFIDKLISFFTGLQSPEAQKRQHFKQLVKDLKKNKYSGFYKTKTEEVTPALANFFYDAYKLASPAQILLQNAEKSATLKLIAAEVFLENMGELKQEMNIEAIEDLAKNNDIQEISKLLDADLNTLASAFTGDRVKAIDHCYTNSIALARFAAFDFFFILKKFDPVIIERNFVYQPQFSAIRGNYISEALKDFIEAAFVLDPEQDWEKVLQALKIYKSDVDILDYAQWRKLLIQIRDIRRSGILEMIIRHIDGKPEWQIKPKIELKRVAAGYLEAKRAEIKTILSKIARAQKNTRLETLAKMVFGTAEISRSQYYTEMASSIYIKKGFEGFSYWAGINYLKAFLLEHLNQELKDLIELLIIRGKWTMQELAQQVPENLYRLLELSGQVTAFDDSLSESADRGGRLKSALSIAEKNKSLARGVRVLLKTINEEARELIETSLQPLAGLAAGLKTLYEDIQKPAPEYLMNWKEMAALSELPLSERLSAAANRVGLFTQMILLIIQNDAEE